MTIVPMTRVTLCGLAREKAEVLSALQDLGCLHVVPLRKAGPLDPPDAASRRRAIAAWRHLTGARRLQRPWPADAETDLDAVVEAALANKERLRQARDRRDALAGRIEDLETFGDFALPPLRSLRGRRLWFYVLPIRDRHALDTLEIPWAIVGRDNTTLNVALVAPDEPPADILPVPRVHTGSRALSHLRQDLEAAEIEIERAEAEHAELTRHRLVLGLRLAEAEDSDERRAVSGSTHDEKRLFAVQGWAPQDAVAAIAALAEALGLALRADLPGPLDEPPTLLRHDGDLQDVGALTRFYMTPSYRSWDPSLIVFASFAIFFAMILADAGYAAMLAFLVWTFKARFGRGETGRRLRVMLFAVLSTALAYGVAAGSYFGIAPPEGSLLAAFVVIDVEDFEAMMRVSVAIGVAHVCIANAEVAWRRRGTPEAIVRLGWIAATLGGLAVWVGPAGLGTAMVVGGLAAVFVASAAARRVTRPVDWLWRLADGALSLTQVTRLFGDVLSYMRLFALGLASASLAATFNALAGDLAEGVAGVGVLLAILVLVFGHMVNLALAVMSGVVHGLRLNFIEFFGWGLSDEGYPFKAFARKEHMT